MNIIITVNMLSKFLKTIIFVLPLLFLFCARKPLLWRGGYANFIMPEQPKEDFKAGDYLIVAYAPVEENLHSKIFFKFAILKDENQIGLICLEKIPECGYLLVYEYFNKNRDLIDEIEKYYKSKNNSYITLSLYKKPITYNELKYYIITRILNLDSLFYTDYNTEGDTINFRFYADGTWNVKITRDIKSTFAVPSILKIHEDIIIKIKEDKTWEFLNDERIDDNNISQVISVSPEQKEVKIYHYDFIERKPQIIYSHKPHYPENMRRKGIEGKSVIGVVVDTNGSVLKAEIMKSSGYGEFDFYALCAGLKFKFTPAIQLGRPVRVWVAIPFFFKL